jgi:hypothetical protein
MIRQHLFPKLVKSIVELHFVLYSYSILDGRIILRWIFRKWDVGVWTGSSWLRIGTGGRHLCGNKPSGSIKCGEFLD